ncbi:MAG TPA: helix-turn-helix domain-containing protein [Chitinophagaceae bacterium]|jgi:AraC-like DNA-binding protein|nr:helix-turn-helix domain-containing protein [Chitinophagaceae bacterium]
MQYQKFRPQEILSPFVECYFIWESSGPLEKELVVESPPNGFCSMVINYGDPYFLQNKKYKNLPVPQQFVSGQSIYSYKLSLNGVIGIAGIVFKPAALATFWGLESFEFTEERIDLFKTLPQDYIKKYVEQIRQAETAVDKVKLMEELLLHHYKIHPPEPDYIDKAANMIVEKNGMLHVNHLLEESCMSRRTFERRFFQKVGLSPKYYARIRRIGYVCNLIAGKKKVNWPEVFYEAEFYDQAHFIKDFEEFTGRTPQQYLRENAELANFVEKPKIQTLP